jgi:predicted component of type VI protein secretion system
LAQVILNDRSVSRLHARITEEEAGRFVLYDEGSTSGSYVNYEPVGIKGQWLQHDDIVNLGRVKMQFKLKSRMAQAHDATIAMKPIRPDMLDKTVVTRAADRVETAMEPEPEPEPEPLDEFATQPYMGVPMDEPASDATQPFLYDSPPQAPSEMDEDDFGDEGISTEPFIPLDPMDLEG